MSSSFAGTKQNNGRTVRLILLIAAAVLLVLYLTVLRPYVLKLRYKLPYAESVIAYSAEFGLDPSLTAAVIFCESGYDPNAKSRVGATGLMQLMPATAEEVAQKLGIEGFTEEMLADPDTNIRMGCYYLSGMVSEFGTAKNALAAYNAGPGRTRTWIGTYGLNEQNELIYIPYPETEKYVERVANAQKVYRALYPQLTPDTGKESD